MKSKKVALIGPTAWALWNINYFVRENLDELGYDVRMFSWEDSKDMAKGLDWCDVFISEVSTFNKLSDDHRRKGMFCWHHLANINEDPLSEEARVKHFTTLIDVSDEFKDHFFATTTDIADSVEAYYGIRPRLLPVGADTAFWKKRDIGKINKLGFVAASNNSKGYTVVKRPEMFQEIADKAELDRVTLNGMSMLCGTAIYKDADMVICTSVSEGHPMAVFESTMAKIPFISTDVGVVKEFPSIRTFSTADEAVEIINDLNSDPEKLKRYVDDVYEDVSSKRDWMEIINKYYVPVIEEIG